MSSKYNQLYGNSALNRALGNIAKTLVGSATDDAAIARANYLDSQTQGQDLKNKNVTDLRASIPQATSVLANNILRSNTGNPNAQFNQSGVPIVDGGNMSMPVSGNPNILPPANMTQENYQGTARAMLGDLTYSPNQFAKAIQNLGGAETAKLAQNLISGGNADQMRRGAILNNMTPGLYFDKGMAQTKIQNDLEAKNFKTTTDAGVDERVGMNKNKLDANVKRIIGLDKNEKVDATARYKFDNRDITIAVGKDKQVFVDKATGVKLGIEPQTLDGREVYILDGRQTVDKVEVKVGKADVYLNEETAKELGIPVNDQGQYIIEGSGFNDSSSGSGNKPKMGNIIKIFDTEFKKYADYGKLPGKTKTMFQEELQEAVKFTMNKENISYQEAFLKEAAPSIAEGTTLIETGLMGGDNFFIPTFIYRINKQQMLSQDNPKPKAEVFKDLQNDLGFTKDQADKILEQMLNE